MRPAAGVTGPLVAGVVAGYGVALPVGAVATYLAGLGARERFRTAAAAALGLATTDALFALVAAIGGAGLETILRHVATPLTYLAAAVLIVLAVRTVGYHGRAGTIVVSGTPVRRPHGQTRQPDGTVTVGPSQRLDFEAEVAFVVGAASQLGRPVPVAGFRDRVFGVCLLNDWSARDIQAWESVPLGPFLGKSFATSVSAWITPLDALAGAWTASPRRQSRVADYLDDSAEPAALDLALEVRNGHTVSRPPFTAMYWTGPQLVAHTTANGAHLRTGDVLASGTVSGSEPDQRGSLLELSWAGAEPLQLPDGSSRAFLHDGDEVVIAALACGTDHPVALGEVRGRVVPAVPASRPRST